MLKKPRKNVCKNSSKSIKVNLLAALLALAMGASFLSGCTGEKEIQGSLTICVPAYLESVYRPMVRVFKGNHPGVEVELIFIQDTLWADPKTDAEVQNIQEDLAAGGGPDLFIGNTFSDGIFPDIAKSSIDGAFLDLSPYLGKELYDSGLYYNKILDGGKFNGKQYVMPLSFQLVGLLTAEELIGQQTYRDIKASQDSVEMLEKAMEFYPQEDYSYLIRMMRQQNLFSLKPFINYESKKVETEQDFEELFALAADISTKFSSEGLAQINDPETIPSPEAPLFGGVIGDVSGLEKRAWKMWKNGMEPCILPIASENGATNAIIAGYAAVNRNCKAPQVAAAFIREVLLTYEVQGACKGAAWGASTIPCAQFNATLPVRKDSLQSLLSTRISGAGASASEEYPQELSNQIHAAIEKTEKALFYMYEARETLKNLNASFVERESYQANLNQLVQIMQKHLA